MLHKIPLLSICIPTYNRAEYLKECFDSITCQFNDKKVYKQVEIIISNNNSKDHTEEIVKKYQKKYKNIKYFKNKRNIGAVRNIIKAANRAKGKYIWFFADDDLQKKDSLATLLQLIKNNKPDVLLCNVDLCSKNGKEVIDSNLLRVQNGKFFKNKREFFSFLETKFFLAIDWYLTCYSNTIVKNKLFVESKKILKKHNKPFNLFPHSAIFYYSPSNYSTYIVSKSLTCFRSENRSFGPKKKLPFLLFWYRVLDIHNKNLYVANKQYISTKFTILLFMKNTTRKARLVFLKLFGVDISNTLIKFFERK